MNPQPSQQKAPGREVWSSSQRTLEGNPQGNALLQHLLQEGQADSLPPVIQSLQGGECVQWRSHPVQQVPIVQSASPSKRGRTDLLGRGRVLHQWPWALQCQGVLQKKKKRRLWRRPLIYLFLFNCWRGFLWGTRFHGILSPHKLYKKMIF